MEPLNRGAKPLAYVLGQVDFMGLIIEVDDTVLIPRQETELLVEKALKLIENKSYPRVVDVGTGSGCIALAIKKFMPDALVFGIDISKQALKIAEKNKNRLNLDANFIHGNFLDPINFQADLIIANLPYLNPKKKYLPELDWEPPSSLFAPENGFGFIKQLLDSLWEKLKKDGFAILEIHPPLVKKIEEYFSLCSIPYSWKIHRDFSNRTRYLEIKF